MSTTAKIPNLDKAQELLISYGYQAGAIAYEGGKVGFRVLCVNEDEMFCIGSDYLTTISLRKIEQLVLRLICFLSSPEGFVHRFAEHQIANLGRSEMQQVYKQLRNMKVNCIGSFSDEEGTDLLYFRLELGSTTNPNHKIASHSKAVQRAQRRSYAEL